MIPATGSTVFTPDGEAEYRGLAGAGMVLVRFSDGRPSLYPTRDVYVVRVIVTGEMAPELKIKVARMLALRSSAKEGDR